MPAEVRPTEYFFLILFAGFSLWAFSAAGGFSFGLLVVIGIGAIAIFALYAFWKRVVEWAAGGSR